ncbi:putative protein tyrosine phosphatase [Phaeomoniella chlamydospora]|uniref:protein-tyrosine-phosphatase n=1 Tax=Phaeomoniella chlamydospora TaxID=158046 RepID=A0A0G2G0T5_PHACM|nr:putative protein tyrosine phosphatase [Phaeomoniella chlamydospora]
MIPVEEVAQLLQRENVLLLDLRVFPQFSASRIRGALNLCIPTTLLKRPSFNIQKLLDTFTTDEERKEFSRWREASHIIVYDASSSQLKEAIAPTHVLKKFVNEGWNGHAHIIKGGFLDFSRKHPDLIDKAINVPTGGSGKQMLSLSSSAPNVAPVAGGCPMPATENAANPFFGNIRQNMDLIGGVGQIPIKQPDNLTAHAAKAIPSWLKSAADASNEGKAVSEKFLEIEKNEQKVMQDALSTRVSYGTPGPQANKKVQIAGIEKGNKNRYNNIFPYSHSRVRLQNVSPGDCDYVNASHVKASLTNKHYVATQAPIPATFTDFWRVVWEQDVRVIMMLTAESEGGQVKSHPYWDSGDYGPLKLKCLSEKKILLEESPKSTPMNPALKRPMLGQRRSTNPHTAAEKTQAKEETSTPSEPPFIIVRHLTLSHSAYPFQPMREITQIQYTSWPDFGAPASPKHLLSLITHADKFVRKSIKSGDILSPSQPMPENQRPVLVHCSAGCGRTGTFCTVDSVIDMLKRQRKENGLSETNAGESDDWVQRDDIDLIAKSVEDFRSQRLSMVQSLRQFVLCYESVLEWIVNEDEKSGGVAKEMQLNDRKGALGHVPRRSFGG